MAIPAVAAGLTRAGQMAYKAYQNASPELKEKALAYVKRATGSRVSDITQIAAYAETKPGLAVAVKGAVKAGINPDTILTNELLSELADADLVVLRNKVRDEFNRLYGPIDRASTFVPSAGTGHDVLGLEVIKFAHSVFGHGDAAVREAHAKLRLFLSMSDEQVTQLLALRKAAR